MKKLLFSVLLIGFCATLAAQTRATSKPNQRQTGDTSQISRPQDANNGKANPPKTNQKPAVQAKKQDKKAAKADNIADARERAKSHRQQEVAKKKK